ncbi:hypothetical protein M20_1345 [Lactococcus lactis subsp. lactis]|uniref:LXG domain-containing protein n=1 Tax=Lactococcus lactis subsp. lactis TaxID=1360 RepID=A0A0V8E4Q0_LACLL|nr:hypothetical protein M20_1345 [Lactococcus lactis subsp. lactis]
MDKGSRHLDSVIDSGTLSGAAYKAGQTMFQTYIFPMIKQLKSAINDIQNDLTSYKTADSQIKSVSNRIDEAQVKAMLANTNQLIALVEQKMRDDKDLIKSFTEKGLSGAITGLSELPGLEGQLDNLKSLKHDYQKQLEAIQTFSFSTNSLFTDSLEAFKYALQGVEIINQSKANVDGTITFPAGADMSWSSKLQAEKFSSQPTEKDKLLQKYANDPETLKQILAYTSEPLNMSVESAEALYLSVKNSDTNMKDFDDKLSQWEQHYSEDKYSKDKFGSFQTFVGTMLTTIGLLDGVDEIFGVGTIVDIEIEEALGTEIIAGGDLSEELINNELMTELEESGVKYNPEEVVMTTKESSGKLDWLENGNDRAGLQHILEEHEQDFLNKGISKEEIPTLLKRALSDGKIIGYQGRGTGRPIYEIFYKGNSYEIGITVGDNGYIVGANPR